MTSITHNSLRKLGWLDKSSTGVRASFQSYC
jgi:hypothetical protein